MKLPNLKSTHRYGSLPGRNLLSRHGPRALSTRASPNESRGDLSTKRAGAVPLDVSLALPNRNTYREAVHVWSRIDPLTQYLREASEVALLTRGEETALARRVQKGDEKAREHMICANLRLVVKIAREYENLGLPLLDLINEGNLGLMKAVDRFDPVKGSRFSTYSCLWIKARIRRALANQSRTIRLPVHVADRIHQLTQAEVRLRGELGRDATDEELAEQLSTRVQSIAKLRRATQRPTSLDAPLAEENSNTVAETVADESAGLPSDQLSMKTETKLVCQLVGKLPEREARIIRLRFGLDSGTERTLEDLGRELRLTRERIRQLQNIALAKLRQMLEQPDLVVASS